MFEHSKFTRTEFISEVLHSELLITDNVNRWLNYLSLWKLFKNTNIIDQFCLMAVQMVEWPSVEETVIMDFYIWQEWIISFQPGKEIVHCIVLFLSKYLINIFHFSLVALNIWHLSSSWCLTFNTDMSTWSFVKDISFLFFLWKFWNSTFPNHYFVFLALG